MVLKWKALPPGPPASLPASRCPLPYLLPSEALPSPGRHFEQRRAGARDAFSLIELLVVVALLLILTTLYWSSTSGSRARQLHTDCQQNLQKLYMALTLYANGSADKFPARAGARTAEEPLTTLVPRFTIDTAPFICPAAKDPPLPQGEAFLGRRISYAYYMGRSSGNAAEAILSDRQVDTLAKAAGGWAFSADSKPPGNNHGKDGGNFLFGDGHVATSPARVPFSLDLPAGVVLLNPRP